MYKTFPSVIDSTMRAAWKACPRKFFWNYLYGIAPEGENIHLHAGGCFARGLEVARRTFYTGAQSYEDSIITGAEALLKMWGPFSPPDDEKKTVDRVLGAYEYYHSQFDMRTDHIQPHMPGGVPAVEFNFVLPIPDTHHPVTDEPILYAGRFDMLGSMKGSDALFVVDEKTTSALGPTWGNQWTLRAQFTGYCWGAQQFGHPVAGAIVRGISILKERYDKAEVIVYRQQWQIEQWLETLQRDLDQMIAQWEEMNFLGGIGEMVLDDNDAIVQASPGALEPWTQSLDAACSAYGGCPFIRLCDSPQPESFIPIYYRPNHWDPTEKKL